MLLPLLELKILFLGRLIDNIPQILLFIKGKIKGDIAQLVERMLCTHEAIGSSPFISTKISQKGRTHRPQNDLKVEDKIAPRADPQKSHTKNPQK